MTESVSPLTWLPELSHEWVVRFRTCNPSWAAQHEHLIDYTAVWDQIPWNRELTETRHKDHQAAVDDYRTLRTLSARRERAVRDVFLDARRHPGGTDLGLMPPPNSSGREVEPGLFRRYDFGLRLDRTVQQCGAGMIVGCSTRARGKRC